MDTVRRPAGVEFHGYYAAVITAAKARNEIEYLLPILRLKKNYALSDLLRGIAQRLDDAVTYPEPGLNREFKDISGAFQAEIERLDWAKAVQP